MIRLGSSGSSWVKRFPGILGTLLSLWAAHAQVNITSVTGFAYTNTFDTLATNGTPAWTDNSTMVGWYSATLSSSTNLPASSYRVSTGSDATTAFYSFGSAASTDRAFGAVPTTSNTGRAAYGIRLRNTTGTTITNVTVAFTGEQWRSATSGSVLNQTLTVSYRISASSITSPDPANSAAWTGVSALTFNSPFDSRTGVALDGNASTNQVALQARFTVSLPNNSEIFIRWVDTDDSGADHGLAIDNVRIYVPEMGTLGPLTLVAAIAAGGIVRRRRSRRGIPIGAPPSFSDKSPRGGAS